jgi:hypothetical protein
MQFGRFEAVLQLVQNRASGRLRAGSAAQEFDGLSHHVTARGHRAEPAFA